MNSFAPSARPSSTRWQHPFVDVFKTFGTDASTGSSLVGDIRGDVSEELDRDICKRVFRVQGSVSANNFIELPSSKANAKSLGLTGEYVYLQVKPIEMKFFLIHLDFLVGGGNRIRITLSNIYSEAKGSYHNVQCPCHLPDQWTVVRLYVPSALTLCRSAPVHAFTLRAIQLCASLCVRNIFTSDRCYCTKTAPREMLGELQPSGGRAYDWAWLDVPTTSFRPSINTEDLTTTLLEVTAAEAGEMISQKSFQSTKEILENNQTKFRERKAGFTAETVGCENSLPDPFMAISKYTAVIPPTRRISSIELPGRFAVFVRCVGVTSPDIGQGDFSETSFSPEINADQESALQSRKLGSTQIVTSTSLALTLFDPDRLSDMSNPNADTEEDRRCYFGHSRPITLLESSDDARWLASVQGPADPSNEVSGRKMDGSEPPVLRLWHSDHEGLRCVSVVPCPAFFRIRAVSFDPQAQYLASAGQDLKGLQQMMVWDISKAIGGHVKLIARQASEWDIDCLRFSPFESLHLVSCGKENIRFWRAKDGHMPGRSVVLNSLARQSHFTAIAFEFNRMGHSYFLGESQAEHVRMFVATSDGKVLKLSYRDRKVLEAYQLHAEAITWMCANEGFVVTASVDRYVRVWPLDFKSYYLQAIHDSSVVGVDITPDGLKVLCSTADGSVGMLDMKSHHYKLLLKTHSSVIVDAAISEYYNELATVSKDGTLKVWSLPTMNQTHEFQIADDEPTAISFHLGKQHLIAVAFVSGTVRIFDVDVPTLLAERRCHATTVLGVTFAGSISSSDASYLISSDVSGALAMLKEPGFDVVNCPEKSLCSRPPSLCKVIYSTSTRLLQYSDPRSALLLELPSLELVRKLRLPGTATVACMAFSNAGNFAALGAADSRIYVFEAKKGKLLCCCSLNTPPLCALAMFEMTDDKPSLLVAATEDQLLRVSQLRSFTSIATDDNLTADEARTVDAEFEQCFLGHASSPSRLLYRHSLLFSLSSSEIIAWEVARLPFEHLQKNERSQQERPEGQRTVTFTDSKESDGSSSEQ